MGSKLLTRVWRTVDRAKERLESDSTIMRREARPALLASLCRNLFFREVFTYQGYLY